MASFGFTFLSRQALGQAEQMLFGGAAGVRDEVGFLIVHQRYADRFFPGTSVLQTRLRYAFLIPWMYQSLRERRPPPKDFAQAFIDLEHAITGRLQFDGEGGERDGVIGGEVYPRASSQPPAYVYWTALWRWGLISTRPDGRPWSRADMARLLEASRGKPLKDEDGKPVMETAPWPIAGLGDPPADLSGTGKMTLGLSRAERGLLARKLRAVRSPVAPHPASLLSRLVGKPLDDADHCWDASILALAGEEKAALNRAGQAAALSAIGRGVYAAQVETLKDVRDRRSLSTIHRDQLPETVALWGRQAASLDQAAFFQDVGRLPEPVEAVLTETLAWVSSGRKDPLELLQPYAAAEKSRKKDRARLADTQFGVDRRLEWQAELHGSPEPLHFRWNNVRRLLRDLEGA
ncbi:MAG: hypothetical protein EON90_10625 [Brevundimonas sp.]|nr:MAG: hypothetical protein EON90_10625 [Brevundimonas sp.]